jgi:hypothetical protein
LRGRIGKWSKLALLDPIRCVAFVAERLVAADQDSSV